MRRVDDRAQPRLVLVTQGQMQDEIDAPLEAQLAQSIADGRRGIDGMRGRQSADNAGEHRDAGQGFGKHSRFVAGGVRVEQH